MDMTIVHVDDNMRDLELASLAFSEIDPSIDYIPVDDSGLFSELKSFSESDARKLPDLIIVDVNMPQMSPHQVIALVRGEERLRNVPIALLTSGEPPFDADALGVPDDVPLLIKPGTYLELVALLRDLAGRVADADGQPI